MKTKTLKWLGLLLIGLTGCYDYSVFDNIGVDPIKSSYVFPVLNDSITIKDILASSDSISEIQENPDHSYSILYRDTIDSGNAAEQFSIPNQNFNYNLTIPGIPAIVVPLVEYPFSQESTNSIQTATTEAGAAIELKGLDCSSGTVRILITNSFKHNISGTIAFSSLINSQGNELVINFDFVYSGPSSITTKETIINLKDYHINAYKAPATYNTFSYKVEGKLTTTNNTVGAGDKLAVNVTVTNPVFSRLTGKINYTFTQDNQSTSVDALPADFDIQQHLEDPRFKLTFVNSFGIPLSAEFSQFMINTKQNVPFNLISNRTNLGDLQIPNKPNKVAQIVRLNQADTSTTYAINRNNSNISAAFDNTPTSIDFGGKFVIGDATANHDYFINHDSKIKLITEAEVPIYGWMIVSMTDSITELDLPKSDELDVSTADIKFNLVITNSIPFDISLQVSFIDELTNTTTLLFEGKPDEQIILSPTVDANGIAVQPTTKTTTISINKARYDLISHATKAKIKFRFALGKVGQSVKVLSTNKLRVKANFYISGTYKPKL